MALKYKCLFIDHDDTSVDSTPVIHYQAHLEVMRKMRPDISPLSLEDWFRVNFDPGIMAYMVENLGMDDREIAEEYEIWRKYTVGRIPDFFPGLIDILIKYKELGGKIVVVSHSEKDLIERDYNLKGFSEKPRKATRKAEAEDFQKISFFPDLIFGWSYDEAKRKPHPWPVLTALDMLQVKAEESLILDDLKPGVLLGQNTGVDVAAAGWSYDIPEIKNYMMENCVEYFHTVREFGDFILKTGSLSE